MLVDISIIRYDRSLRFIAKCLAGLRKQAAKTCRKNIVSSRVQHQRKRSTFVDPVQSHPLAFILQPVKSREGN